jgi:hypothetical protein
MELLQRLLVILEQRQRKLQNIASKPSVLEHSKFLLLCSRTLQQARQRGTNPSNPKAGQLAAKVAKQNTKNHSEPQQPERLVVRGSTAILFLTADSQPSGINLFCTSSYFVPLHSTAPRGFT